ncbi:efflux RND transporter periplasmic adaptor subunit [Marinobacter metalliresistant]|uniref:Efflux RND transporter periplasmic adaptor subunit n=1 Tax=Marinobacter metalliresistant TaxID=2961995 RepID=A0ABZ2VXI4_9GAMM
MTQRTTFISLFVIGLLVGIAGILGLQWLSGEDATTAAPAEGPPLSASYRSGPFQLGIDIEPDTPRVGINDLTLALLDGSGERVSGAAIKAVAEMPAMGTMPAMQAPADMQEIEPGLYRGTFEPLMEGSWPLTLQISKEGVGSARANFDLATGRKGLQPASGVTALTQGAGGARTDGGDMAEEAPPGMVTLDNRRRQLIGVKTAEAQAMTMTRTIRAEGRIAYDETRLADVSLKFDAWIGELYADYVGVHVAKGEPLFTVYGPELLATQQEYLELKRRGSASRTLVAAARKRLELWDMTAGEIANLEKRGEPFDYVAMHAPISGTVVAKNVVEGTAHKAGMTLLRIADLSQVWVEADIYEGELPLLTEGMPVTVTLPYLPGEAFEGRVDYVYPYLDGASRTGRVRLTVANPEGRLKPDMYAEVKLKADLGRRVAVPEAAVIIAGELRVVFEDLGEGRLAPRKVQTGQRAGGFIEIIEGIEAGDRVVTSGNFLIASESRLKAGMEQW